MTVAYDHHRRLAAQQSNSEPTGARRAVQEEARKSKTGHGVGAKPVSKAELNSSRWPVAEMSNIYCLPVQLFLRAMLKGLEQPSTGSL